MNTLAYYSLIKDFIEGAISVEYFVSQYTASLKSEVDTTLDERVFSILEDLFEDIDAYSPFVLPENETSLLISEKTLRDEARDALQKLEKFL